MLSRAALRSSASKLVSFTAETRHELNNPVVSYLDSLGSRPVNLRILSSTFFKLSLAFSSWSCKLRTATAILRWVSGSHVVSSSSTLRGLFFFGAPGVVSSSSCPVPYLKINPSSKDRWILANDDQNSGRIFFLMFMNIVLISFRPRLSWFDRPFSYQCPDLPTRFF